jgi:hypothetical protein
VGRVYDEIDSCGYGVPLMSVEGRRPHMDACAARKLRVGGPEAITVQPLGQVSAAGVPDALG